MIEEKLPFPLIKKNVNTIAPINGNNEFTTRVFSDYFSSYRESDFIGINYILHRVNHSVWFGQGMFHTNTVEGLWSCIKRISNGFSGINFGLLSDLEKEGIDAKSYIDDWLCYCLFMIEIEKIILVKVNLMIIYVPYYYIIKLKFKFQIVKN